MPKIRQPCNYLRHMLQIMFQNYILQSLTTLVYFQTSIFSDIYSAHDSTYMSPSPEGKPPRFKVLLGWQLKSDVREAYFICPISLVLLAYFRVLAWRLGVDISVCDCGKVSCLKIWTARCGFRDKMKPMAIDIRARTLYLCKI